LLNSARHDVKEDSLLAVASMSYFADLTRKTPSTLSESLAAESAGVKVVHRAARERRVVAV
jgi:hypothetical protein